ncbi:MAG: trypsin-like peptidase domain-containing protein [Terracidiphilus sp.]
MKLTEVVRRVSPAVVAFGSRFYPSETSTAPAFPLIIGTGFIVDKRGMVLTNQHVVDAIERFPAPARFVMLFPEPKAKDGQTMFGVVLRKIKAVNSVSSFESSGPFFGQAKPDCAFVQIDIQGLPFVEVCGDSNVLEVGLEVATLGFPMGDVPLSPYEQGKASQISAFARRGIVSSVLPCSCADPHGFSIDILSEGGASGSPIFRTDDPKVIGILHAGFQGAPIKYGVPGHFLDTGLKQVQAEWRPDLTGVPTLDDVIEQDVPNGPKGFDWTILKVPVQE